MTEDSAGKWISILHRYFRSYLEESLQDLGLGVGQIPILMTLYRQDGLRQDDIARTLQLDKSSLARNIKKLEQMAYISRETDPSDHRAYTIRLLPPALEIQEYIHKTLKDWTTLLLQDFSEQERHSLFHLLHKAARNVGHNKDQS